MAVSDERVYWEGVLRPVFGAGQTADLRECTSCEGTLMSPNWTEVRSTSGATGHSANCRHLAVWEFLEANGYTTEPPPGSGGGGLTSIFLSTASITLDNASVRLNTLSI